MNPDRDTRYSMPLPKINVPPPAGSGVEVPEMMPPTSAWLAPKPVAPSRLDHASGNRRDAIRWDFRFVASLILLTLVVNLALAVLLRQRGEPGSLFITHAARQEGLPELAPAAGDEGGTTIYLQDEERQQMLERLDSLRQPGLVSLPPAPPALTPDEQTETGGQ